MRIGIVGCGFVADYYMATLPLHPELRLIGAHDRDADRRAAFAAHHGVRTYPTLDELLGDDEIDLVVNLTNPRSHFEVSRRALDAGKHVYSEKPLAMDLDDAVGLVELAKSKGLGLSGAPCSLLGETAQTLWRGIRDGVVGPVRLAYVEMDEGMVFRMPYRRWASASGAPWPYRDEFEIGTTIEHAGYVVTWLPAFFGPAEVISGYSATLIADKGVDPPLERLAPDLAVACIRFESGVVARLTCSLVAPHDHSVRIVGDEGVVSVEDTWYYRAPVRVRRWLNVRGRHMAIPWPERYPPVARGERYRYRGTQQMDFARGVAELASSIDEGRRSRLPADYVLHCNEIVLAVSGALDGGGTYAMTTGFEPVEPMPWAVGPRKPTIGGELRRRVGAMASGLEG
jgi:predicted dehydrogenase